MRLPEAIPRSRGDLAQFAKLLYRRFDEDRCLQVAGSLTYTTLLALVPLVTVALALTTAFPVFGAFTSGVDDWLAENVLPEQIAGAITRYLGQFAEKAAQLTAIGILVLAATAVLTMVTVDRALNQIFRVSRPRPLPQQLLTYWAVLTLGPVLMGLSITMTSYLVTASLGWARAMPFLGKALLGVVPVVLTSLAITLLYLWVPNRRVRLAHALIGGLAAGLLFELTKRGFALYVAKFPTYTLVYGAFATVPIFLAWLYLSWVIVLAGAVLTAVLPGYYRGAERRGGAAGRHFSDALALLGELAGAQRRGGHCALTALAAALHLAPEQCERLLSRMERTGWVARAAGEDWLLARDAGAIRAADVYHLFVLDSAAAAPGSVLAALLAGHEADVAARMQATLNDLFPEAGP